MKKIKIKLEKLEERLDAKHPDNIQVGFKKIGEMIDFPRLGNCFWVGKSFRTSVVEEIIDINTFKTVNSIYRYIEIKDNE